MEDLTKLWLKLQSHFINESIEDKGILKSCFMGGSPGSGKSYTIEKVKSGQIEPRIVNTDKMSAFLAAQMNLDINTVINKWGKYGSKIKKLSQNQLALYLNSMLPLFVDSTSSNPSAVFRRQGLLKSIGYDTAFIWVETSLETAIERNRQRDKNVDEDFLIRTHKKIQDLKPYYKSEFKNFVKIKNDEGELTNDMVLNAYRKISNFFNSDVENPIGKKLIENMRSKGQKYLIDVEDYDMQYIKNIVSSWYKKQ
ncbi:MAG: AAA family ATPase [archaeon]